MGYCRRSGIHPEGWSGDMPSHFDPPRRIWFTPNIGNPLTRFNPHGSLKAYQKQEYIWSGFKDWVEILKVDLNRFMGKYYSAKIVWLLVKYVASSMRNILSEEEINLQINLLTEQFWRLAKNKKKQVNLRKICQRYEHICLFQILFKIISVINIQFPVVVILKYKRKQNWFRSESNRIEYLIIVSNLRKKLESGKGIHSNEIHKWNTLWNLN